MYRPLRRKDREIPAEAAAALMSAAEYGVLATVDAAGQPYATPLSFVFDGAHIYFHCADEGHKLDNLRACSRVSFCVVGSVKTLPRHFATEYESAVAFGVACEVSGEEKRAALLKLLEKYSPGFLVQGKKYLDGHFAKTAVVRIDVERLTGKARR